MRTFKIFVSGYDYDGYQRHEVVTVMAASLKDAMVKAEKLSHLVGPSARYEF